MKMYVTVSYSTPIAFTTPVSTKPACCLPTVAHMKSEATVRFRNVRKKAV